MQCRIFIAVTIYRYNTVRVLIYNHSPRIHTKCSYQIFKLLCTIYDLAFIQFICQMCKYFCRKFYTHTNIHTIHSRNNRNICTTSPTLTAQLPENLGLNYTKMYSLSHFAPRSQHTPIPSQKSTIRDRRATASPMTKNGPHEPSNVPLTARQHKRLPRSPPTAGRASTHVHFTASAARRRGIRDEPPLT